MVEAMVYAGLPNDFQVMAKYGVHTSEHGEIVMAVCIALGVEQKAIYSKGRTRKLSEARQIACYLLREFTSLTLKQIGDIFGRDHSTVLYGIDTCKDLMKVDIPFQRKVYRVKSLL